MTGIYIHIPFCVKKCSYCAFDSISNDRYTDSFVNRYIYAICKEIFLNAFNEEGSPQADTIFFGGGTPSLLAYEAIEHILKHIKNHFELSPDTEISIEANPGTIDYEKLLNYKQIGINRISIGGQTFSDEHLKNLGRIHNSEELNYSLKTAAKIGFTSVNLDLIFGFPGQNLKSFKSDLEKTVSYGIKHISTYAFTPEENTILGESVSSGAVKMPCDDEFSDMMNLTHDFLTSCGYVHYETSNYCIEGHQCRHNLKYWNYDDYRGFGSSACSFRNRFRYKNTANPHDYVYKTEHNFLPLEYGERLSEEKAAGEYIMLALRTSKGLSETIFKSIFGKSFYDHYFIILEELQKDGLLVFKNEFWTIPYEYFPIQNKIYEKFIYFGN